VRLDDQMARRDWAGAHLTLEQSFKPAADADFPEDRTHRGHLARRYGAVCRQVRGDPGKVAQHVGIAKRDQGHRQRHQRRAPDRELRPLEPAAIRF
jgi:hypothetical protein